MRNIVIILPFVIMVSCSSNASKNLDSNLIPTGSNEEQQRTMAVEVQEMIPGVFSRYFEVSGFMEAIKDAYISPEINGQVKRVLVERGARVRKNQLLVSLNTDLTETSIKEVKTSLELASKIFEKQEELWQQKIGSEIQFLEAKNGKESLEARLESLQLQYEMAHIRAPFAGIVDDIMVKEGELASPGMRLVQLINLDIMRVSARVSEAYLNSIHSGDSVELRFSSYPEELLLATVSRLGEVIEEQTRTFVLEVMLKNKDEKFKPNMLTSVRIEDYRDEKALVVPSIILKQDFEGTFLFNVKESEAGTIAKKVYVNTGITVQDQTAIEDGLTPEDLVITKGHNLVGDGSLVQIINK